MTITPGMISKHAESLLEGLLRRQQEAQAIKMNPAGYVQGGVGAAMPKPPPVAPSPTNFTMRSPGSGSTIRGPGAAPTPKPHAFGLPKELGPLGKAGPKVAPGMLSGAATALRGAARANPLTAAGLALGGGYLLNDIFGD